MHRTSLLQALDHYRAQYADEGELIERFTNFVKTYPDCFERSLDVGHVTGSAWLVNEPGTHVLLTHHRKLNMWIQLGGHADGDADVQRVALTEAREESGLARIEPIGDTIFDVDIHAIPARGADPAHFHYDVRFAFRALGSDAFTVSDESHALAWCAIEQIPELTPEVSMHRMARKWLQQYGSAAEA
jgi:8-oxo-dGTP pyrophosphatase MutT (NUDIX family)